MVVRKPCPSNAVIVLEVPSPPAARDADVDEDGPGEAGEEGWGPYGEVLLVWIIW